MLALDGTATLRWDLDAGHAHDFTLEADAEVSFEGRATVPVASGRLLEIDFSQELSGTLSSSGRIEVE